MICSSSSQRRAEKKWRVEPLIPCRLSHTQQTTCNSSPKIRVPRPSRLVSAVWIWRESAVHSGALLCLALRRTRACTRVASLARLASRCRALAEPCIYRIRLSAIQCLLGQPTGTWLPQVVHDLIAGRHHCVEPKSTSLPRVCRRTRPSIS